MDRDIQQSRSRLEFLDALRGLAALYVVVFHMLAMPDPHLPAPSALAGIAGFGGSGVALFFLMSAFSLCYTMPRHLASEVGVASFYLHRIFRIAPLLFFWLVLMVATDALRSPHRYSLVEVAANLTLIYNLIPTWQPGIVTASWTVGVEMLFYAVFPVIFAIVRSVRSAVAALFLSSATWWLCLQFGGDALAHLTGPMGVLFQLPVFMAGMLCFALWRSEALASGTAQERFVGIALTAVGCTGIVALAEGWLGPLTFAQNWYVVAACYGLVLLGLSQVPLTLFINRCTRHLGTLSYSIYLAHPVVISRLHGLYAWAYGPPP